MLQWDQRGKPRISSLPPIYSLPLFMGWAISCHCMPCYHGIRPRPSDNEGQGPRSGITGSEPNKREVHKIGLHSQLPEQAKTRAPVAGTVSWHCLLYPICTQPHSWPVLGNAISLIEQGQCWLDVFCALNCVSLKWIIKLRVRNRQLRYDLI